MTLVAASLRTLAEGVALQLKQDADPAQGFAWDAAADYAPNDVGIYLAVIPPVPDLIVSLSPRQLTADPTLADSEYALQARFRGTTDPRVVWGMRDAARAVILGRFPTVLPNGLPVQSVTFAGGTPLPADSADRTQWSDNYVYRVGEHRTRPF